MAKHYYCDCDWYEVATKEIHGDMHWWIDNESVEYENDEEAIESIRQYVEDCCQGECNSCCSPIYNFPIYTLSECVWEDELYADGKWEPDRVIRTFLLCPEGAVEQYGIDPSLFDEVIIDHNPFPMKESEE